MVSTSISVSVTPCWPSLFADLLPSTAVHELNKLNEFSVGSTLRIAGIKQPYNYSDFDELIVSHIKQMALKVNEMTSHEKFKGTAQELGALRLLVI